MKTLIAFVRMIIIDKPPDLLKMKNLGSLCKKFNPILEFPFTINIDIDDEKMKFKVFVIYVNKHMGLLTINTWLSIKKFE